MDFVLRNLRHLTHVPERGLNILVGRRFGLNPCIWNTAAMLAFRLEYRDRDEPAQEGRWFLVSE